MSSKNTDSRTERREGAPAEESPRLFGIIGDPIGHTLSPLIHTRFAEKTGKSIRGYLPFAVRREDLSDAIRGAHALGIAGMNVTVPHKSGVIPLLAGIDPLAAKIGAVNTLIYQDDGYRGCNTDATGLKCALLEAGVTLAGTRVVILGAGGAARAAAFLCVTEGAAEVVIINRTADKAAALAADVNEKTEKQAARAADLSSFLSEPVSPERKYLAIQCTSVGLSPDTEHAPVEDPAFFERLFFAVDIVYRPLMTKFLWLARQAGLPVLGGLSMLLYQAADAFSLWFPDTRLTQSDLRSVMCALKAELLGGSCIRLIGFMGSGKTTIGQTLADVLGFDLWDTDRMIEESCRKTVSEIFARDGEEMFRRMETATLKMIAEALSESPWEGETDGLILSTGGGLPVREENRRWLRQTPGSTVYLRARPETILARLSGDSTRPLLSGEDQEEKRSRTIALLAEREDIYESCADLVIDTDGKTPEAIAAEILAGLPVKPRMEKAN
ncbi:MAG: shikimate dehydrogenase [Lachnospiraceae bacterium]|nr:shikimate dehydrogenase [Lachnospiraceae bacterium]